jgi:ABC-type phosphate transport system permease subunit
MEKNVGSGDRLFRIIIAGLLIALIFLVPLQGLAAIIAGAIAAVLLVTALLSRCPFSKLAGIDTTMKESSYSTTDDRAGL